MDKIFKLIKIMHVRKMNTFISFQSWEMKILASKQGAEINNSKNYFPIVH